MTTVDIVRDYYMPIGVVVIAILFVFVVLEVRAALR